MPKKAEQPVLFEEGEIAAAPDKVLHDGLDIFNQIAARVNVEAKATIWNGAKVLTDARRKRLKTAISDCGGLHQWRKVLEDASRNAFLLGKEGRTAAHRNWRPDLDFFIQPKTVVKLIENGYPAAIEKAKRIFIPGASQPAHLKPAEPFKHDIESPEDRMAFTISAYRKRGRWADANRMEEQLAALQKRPPVLVPAPDVAHFGLASEPMRDSQKATDATTDNNRHAAMPENQPVQRAQPKPSPRAAPNGSAAPGPRQATPAHITDLEWEMPEYDSVPEV